MKAHNKITKIEIKTKIKSKFNIKNNNINDTKIKLIVTYVIWLTSWVCLHINSSEDQ